MNKKIYDVSELRPILGASLVEPQEERINKIKAYDVAEIKRIFGEKQCWQ